MNIIEQASIPKSPTARNEDGIVVTADFIAVVDGSTSKTSVRHHPRMSNGSFAAAIVSQYISKMKADTSCHQFCIGVTEAVRRHYLPFRKRHKAAILARLQEHPEERLSASAAVFSRLRREVWLVGDCQCLVGGQLYENPKPYEQPLAEQRAREALRLIANGTTPRELSQTDTARQSIIPRMLEEMRNQNVTYAVIDGFSIPEQKVKIITLDFNPWDIVLATDGYPVLCPTLQQSEEKLQWQLDNDPLNIGQYKATKGLMQGFSSFDDRTYVRFCV